MVYVKSSVLAKKVKGLRHNGHSSYSKIERITGCQRWEILIWLKNKWPYKFTLSEIQWGRNCNIQKT